MNTIPSASTRKSKKVYNKSYRYLIDESANTPTRIPHIANNVAIDFNSSDFFICFSFIARNKILIPEGNQCWIAQPRTRSRTDLQVKAETLPFYSLLIYIFMQLALHDNLLQRYPLMGFQDGKNSLPDP